MTKIKTRTKTKTGPQQANPRWPLRQAGGVSVLRAGPLEKLDWLTHGFSTRRGSASKFPAGAHEKTKPEHVLNLGFTEWDTRMNVLRNRAEFRAAVRAPEMTLVPLRQFHSDVIHVLASAPSEPLRGDALITAEPGLLLAMQTADCLPILLADNRQHVVAAIHAGWRGTLRRIAGKTVGRMQLEFGSSPEDIVAAIGPGIGRCCYEVGGEVVREFAAQFASAREWFDGPFDQLSGAEVPINLPWLTMIPPGHEPPPVRAYLDLEAANRSILEEAGVPPQNIHSSGLCTACRKDLHFSYRREHQTGRLMGAIGMRAGKPARRRSKSQ
jgi:polyphenol oxidase